MRRMLLYMGSWYFPLVNCGLPRGEAFLLWPLPFEPAFSCHSIENTRPTRKNARGSFCFLYPIRGRSHQLIIQIAISHNGMTTHEDLVFHAHCYFQRPCMRPPVPIPASSWSETGAWMYPSSMIWRFCCDLACWNTLCPDHLTFLTRRTALWVGADRVGYSHCWLPTGLCLGVYHRRSEVVITLHIPCLKTEDQILCARYRCKALPQMLAVAPDLTGLLGVFGTA